MTRLAFRIFTTLGFCIAWTFGSASSESVLDLDCSTPQQAVSIPADASLTIRSGAKQPLFLLIDERGDTLTAKTTDDASVSHVPVPYRYALHLARLAPGQALQLQRATPSKRAAAAQLSVDCSTVAGAVRHRDWLSAVAATTKSLNGFLSDKQVDPLLESINRLAAKAENAFDAGLAVHIRAHILLLGSRSADSVLVFEAAAKAWRLAGDEARERVALVAEVEDLHRLARHADALALVDNVAASLPDRDYFAARLRLSRCLTLHYMGRRPEAVRCFGAGVTEMEQLDEIPDLVSALQDMADVSRYLGDLAGARKLALRALQLSTLPQMEIQRGSIHRTLADIAVAQGDIATTITEFDLALNEFVASGSQRWQANVLLQTAQLYADLGALDEAADMVAAALGRLSERDAPARVAAARVVRADIDARRGRIDAARRGLTDALLTYRSLAIPVDLDSARLAQARLALHSGDIDSAAEWVGTRDRQQQLHAIDWRLLAARIDAAQGNCAAAASALQKLDGKLQTIENEVERVTASADCMAKDGKFDAAQARLFATAKRIASLAQQIESPLLRQMLVGTIAPLRRSAFRLAAGSGSSKAHSFALPLESVWRWLRIDDSTPQRQTDSPDQKSAASFDSEVASELLGKPESTSAAAPRQLLALLARDAPIRSRQGSKDSNLSLHDFQQRLGDAVFVSYVDAGEQSQLLWISRDSVRLQPTLPTDKLAADTERLLQQVSSAAMPVQKIMADAARLSGELLGEKSSKPESGELAPATLLVDASSRLAVLPWSVLIWPNATQPLLETTRISIIRIGAPELSPPIKPEVTVLVAGETGNGKFGALWNARTEPSLISTAIQPKGGHFETLIANDRTAVLNAFASPHSWLHVAAHGDSRASRMGYAGIWLDAKSPTESPGFVSWLEIVARGSRNDLVVINACDLAVNPDSRAAALSFADAVSRAGARDVVAARWQVSDAATALWVPTFYRQMAQGADPAEALWQVRRQLHDSRHFRHPFHWAAFVHYGHL